MRSLYEEAKALQDQIVADRRYLHQIPEVGMDLPESAAYIEKRLTEMGIESRRCGVMPDAIRRSMWLWGSRTWRPPRCGGHHRQRQPLHPAAGGF